MVLTHHSKVKCEVLGANDRSLMVGCSPHPAIMAPLPVLAEGPCHRHCPHSLALTRHLPQCWS